MLEIGYMKHGQYGVVDEVENLELGEKLIARLQRSFPARNGVYVVVDTFNGDTNILSAS